MKKIYVVIIGLLLLPLAANAQWLWNIDKMEEIKSQKTSLSYYPAYKALLEDADHKLSQGTYSVTYKEFLAPSGDKHDYVSLSRYWWPDLTKEGGMPYVHKDGLSNPDLDKYDRNRLGEMGNAVNVLSLAYFYSGNEHYAEKAMELIRVWFLNKETKMNPNLNYSQFVPGRDNSKGQAVGLIDSYSFVPMLNSLQLLKQSPSYTNKEEKELQKWFAAFADWFRTSPQGVKESEAKNNHSTAYDLQLATYLLFAGKTKEAEKIIDAFPQHRIFAQIEPDGKQPNELWRTLAYHYSQYNLSHMLDMAAIAKTMGKELYKMESSDGRSIYKAIDYLVSFLGKDVSEWPYKQISGWDAKQQDLCLDLYRIVDMDPSKTDYLTIYKKYSKRDSSDRSLLYYGAEDAIGTSFTFASNQFDYAFTCIAEALANTDKKNLVNPRSINKDGGLRMINPRDWCSGFFPGSLWFMYEYTKDDKWKEKAIKHTLLIEEEQFDRTSHDVGFKMYNSFGNGYKLTDNAEYKKVVIQSAETLSKRFNEKIGSIRSWDFNRQMWQFPVIIDNMMNLELLFEASKLSGNPSFYRIADAHAMTTMINHFRDDYSSYHVVDYDTISAKAIKKQTFQGYADPTAWARGQAWGLYGFTMSYRYTKRTEYLNQAVQIANFIFSHPNLPKDLIPYWDFNDPAIPDAPRDASAACITASALYELAGYDNANKSKYIGWADTILSNLIKDYKADEGTHKGFLLLHSTGHHPGGDEIDVPICYADYYFLEALLRRNNMKDLD